VTVRDGIRSGLRMGGPSGGFSPDPGLTGVTRDSTSGIYCPANAAEWATVMTVAGITSGGPSLLWNCQESSGNLADSIGTFTGTVSGTPVTYQQAVTGWTRKGIAGADAGSGLVGNSDTGLPDTATTSMLSLGYAIVTSVQTGQSNISVIGSGSTNVNASNVGGVSKLGVVSVGNSALGAVNTVGAVRPYGVIHDVTNNRVAGWSDQEVLNIARGAVTTKNFRMFLAFPGSHLYRVAFFGSAAELTNAQIKTLLTVLGWTIPW